MWPKEGMTSMLDTFRRGRMSSGKTLDGDQRINIIQH